MGTFFNPAPLNDLLCNSVANYKVSGYFCITIATTMKIDSTIPTGHSHSKADFMGIAGSVLCLIHCLITPILAMGGSLSAHSHTIGGVIDLDYFFILINGIAVYFATREHRIPALRVFLWGSFLLFAVSLILENHYPAFTLLGYLGSGLLIAGHVYNVIYCRPWRVVNQ